jgi:hypothetical protein
MITQYVRLHEDPLGRPLKSHNTCYLYHIAGLQAEPGAALNSPTSQQKSQRLKGPMNAVAYFHTVCSLLDKLDDFHWTKLVFYLVPPRDQTTTVSGGERLEFRAMMEGAKLLVFLYILPAKLRVDRQRICRTSSYTYEAASQTLVRTLPHLA